MARKTVESGLYRAYLYSEKLVSLEYYPGGNGASSTQLGAYSLPKPLQPRDTVLLELRLQGDRLTVLVDGAVAIEAQDSRCPGPGKWGIFATDGWFEPAEVRALSTAAVAPPIPLVAPSAAGWQPLFTEAEWKQTAPGEHELVDGRLHLRGGPSVSKPQPAADCAIRARIQFQEGSKYVGFETRKTAEGGFYKAHLSSDRGVTLEYYLPGGIADSKKLGNYYLPKPLQPGDTVLLELRMQGDRLTVLVDGATVIRVQDSHCPGPGQWHIIASDGWFESVEVQTLPTAKPPAQASAAPITAATKDAPFVNSLGMKFVPVPGTNVLFCIHETRWRDCGAYVNDTGAEMSARGKDFVLGGAKGSPDMPAAHVSWDDAQAFCVWLSHQEGRTYRLPTDREWSQAVGIGDQEKWTADTTPATVNQVPDQFPWGTEWPPPKGAGNYGDETFHAKDPKAAGPYLKGYDDGFAATAPVMSFTPNRLGIYDLGGNVAEWVADWYDASQQKRTARGSAFSSGDRDALLSSKRAFTDANFTVSGVGFRIVVERPPAAKPTPPPASEVEKWLAQVDGPQQEAYKKQVVQPFEAALAEMRTRYLAALDAAIAKASAASQLTEALAFRTERQTFAEAQNVPADDAGVPPAVQTMRANFRQQLAKLDQARLVKAKALFAVYDAILEKNQALLTQRQRLDEALLLKTKRDELAGAWLAPSPLLPAAATASPEPARAIPAPPAPPAIKDTGIRPTAATRETPFVNTLDMQFVPVAITHGPTAGKRVLFGIWDVRVQDYRVFADETKRPWPKPAFSQDSAHPAVNVSWEDSKAFCAWLTERERKAGKLAANEEYRLPSDVEWSCAVGLPPEPGDFPAVRTGRNQVDFPWGRFFPPKKPVGNYGEQLFADGYVQTSSVGAFPANRFGLFDMGGNVWQWCEDLNDTTHPDRTLRGGSWRDYDREPLLSSMRYHYVPASRSEDRGFRCVLGVSAR